MERAKVAAQEALAADETSVKAHMALGWVLWFYDRDWAAAEQQLRSALDLNSSYSSAHNLYALELTTRGRFSEALAEVNRARELDPMTFLVSTDLGLVQQCSRHSRSGGGRPDGRPGGGPAHRADGGRDGPVVFARHDLRGPRREGPCVRLPLPSGRYT